MISGAAMVLVYACFPAAQFVNAFIFQVRYFDVLCILIIFLLIGVGCDACFVYYDAFKGSRILAAGRDWEPDEIMTLRLKYTLARGRKAIGVCSGTTAGAFFANLASLIMPTAQFGLYSGSAIFICFVFSSTFFVSVLVVHELYFERMFSGPRVAEDGVSPKTEEFDITKYPKINRLYYNELSENILNAKIILIPFCLVLACC